MLRDKVSEFSYKPVVDSAEGLVMRKNNWISIFKMPFFYKNYARDWCTKYLETIKKPIEEHRSLTAERFQNRIDYVEMSAFGVDYKLNKNEVEAYDDRAIRKMIRKSRGIGRLAMGLSKLDEHMDLLIFKIVGQALKYDFYLEKIFGEELIRVQKSLRKKEKRLNKALCRGLSKGMFGLMPLTVSTQNFLFKP